MSKSAGNIRQFTPVEFMDSAGRVWIGIKREGEPSPRHFPKNWEGVRVYGTLPYLIPQYKSCARAFVQYRRRQLGVFGGEQHPQIPKPPITFAGYTLSKKHGVAKYNAKSTTSTKSVS
jgi:hypothetical protein